MINPRNGKPHSTRAMRWYNRGKPQYRRVRMNGETPQPAPQFVAGDNQRFYTVVYSTKKRGNADFRMQGTTNSGRIYASAHEAVEAAKKLSTQASDESYVYYVMECFACAERPKPQAEVVELK